MMGSKPVGISGSRAAAILGLSQYSTPFTVWQELMEQRHGEGWNAKRGYIYEPFEGNPATEFGKAFESAIINLTEQAIGDSIVDRERAYSLPDMDYVTCHIDGRFKGKESMYEGKSCNHRAFSYSWGEPGTDRIPQSYQVQNQHSMLCSGLSETTMGVLVFPKTVDEWAELGYSIKVWPREDGGEPERIIIHDDIDGWINPAEWAKTLQQMGFFHQYHIEAKPDTQKILKELYAEFWGRYIIGDEVPEAVDYSDVRRMFTAPKGVLVIDDKMRIAGISAADAMREYKDCGIQLGKKSINSVRREFLKVKILSFVKEQTTVMDDEGQEKIVMRDGSGNKLGQFDGKTYRS